VNNGQASSRSHSSLNFGSNAELSFALLEKLPDFPAVAAQERNSKRLNSRFDLVEMPNEQRQVNRMRKRDPERANFTALERRGELARSGRGIIALLEQRVHAKAELGQLRGRAFAAKKIAAEFCLKLLDRPRQRRLGDIALIRGAGEVEHTRDGEEVANLMHLHDRALA